MPRALWIATFAVFAGLPVQADIAIGYTATNLGALSGASGPTTATSINATGQATGSSPTGSGDQHAFLYGNGVMVDLGTLGGTTSGAYGINASGQVVGSSATAAGDQHAFLYSNGVMADLGTLGGTSSAAYGINAAGKVVGTLITAAGYPEGFSYANGTMTPITYSSGYNYTVRVAAPAVNASGDVLIDAIVFDGLTTQFPVFLLHNNAFMPLVDALTFQCTTLATGVVIPLWSQFEASALNDAGVAVGLYNACPDSSSSSTDIAWSSDSYTGLTLPSGQGPSRALAINNSNTVVGEYTSPSGLHAFAAHPQAGPLDLNDLVAPGALASGEVLTSASAVNDGGLIVAQSNLGHAYILSPSRWVAAFTPANLSFGSQPVNTVGSSQAASYTNSGAASASIDGVTAPANFSQTNDCGTVLAAGASCTIHISFAPKVPGVNSSLVNVTIAGVPYHVAAVAGTSTFTSTLSSDVPMTTVGHPVTLTWTSFAGATCKSTGGTSVDYWAGRDLAGSGSLAVTEQVAGNYTYSLQCTYGSVSTATSQVVVKVSPPPAVTLSADPSATTAGMGVVLTWNSTNAASCSASGGRSGDGWAGVKTLSGRVSVTEAAAGTFTYTLRCLSGPSSAQASTRVSFSAQPATGGGGGIDLNALLALGAALLLRARCSRRKT